jgi:hypothetical protein
MSIGASYSTRAVHGGPRFINQQLPQRFSAKDYLNPKTLW